MYPNQNPNDFLLFQSSLKYKPLPTEDSQEMMIKKSAHELKKCQINGIERIFVSDFFDSFIKASMKLIRVSFKVLLQHIYIEISILLKGQPNQPSKTENVTMNIGEFILRCPRARALLQKNPLQVDQYLLTMPIILYAFENLPQFWDDLFEWKTLELYELNYHVLPPANVTSISRINIQYSYNDFSSHDRSIFNNIFDFNVDASANFDIENCKEQINKYYQEPKSRVMVLIQQGEIKTQYKETLIMLAEYLFKVWRQQKQPSKLQELTNRLMKSEKHSSNESQVQNQLQSQSFNIHDSSSLVKRGSSSSDPINIENQQLEIFGSQKQTTIINDQTLSDRSTPQQITQNIQGQNLGQHQRDLQIQNSFQQNIQSQLLTDFGQSITQGHINTKQINQQQLFNQSVLERQTLISLVDNHIESLKSLFLSRKKVLNNVVNDSVMEAMYVAQQNNLQPSELINQFCKTCSDVNNYLWQVDMSSMISKKSRQEIEHHIFSAMYNFKDLQDFTRHLSETCQNEFAYPKFSQQYYKQFIIMFLDQIETKNITTTFIYEFYNKMIMLHNPYTQHLANQLINDIPNDDSKITLTQFVYQHLEKILSQCKQQRDMIYVHFKLQELIELQCQTYKGLCYFMLMMHRYVDELDKNELFDFEEFKNKDDNLGGAGSDINWKIKSVKEHVPYIDFKIFQNQRETSLQDNRDSNRLLLSKDINNKNYNDKINQLPIEVQKYINEAGILITFEHIRLYCEPTILQIKDFPLYDLILYRMIQVHSKLAYLNCDQLRGSLYQEEINSSALITLPFQVYNEKDGSLTDVLIIPPKENQTFSDCKLQIKSLKTNLYRKLPYWRQADQVMWLFNTLMQQQIYTSRDVFIMLSTLVHDPTVYVDQIVQDIRYPLVHNDPFPLSKLSQLMLFDKKTMNPKKLTLMHILYGCDLSEKLNYIDEYIAEHKHLNDFLLAKTDPLIVEIFFTYKETYHGRIIVIIAYNNKGELVISTPYRGERLMDKSKKQPQIKNINNKFLKLIEEHAEGVQVKIFSVRFYKLETEKFLSFDRTGNQTPFNIFKFRNMLAQFFMKFHAKDLKQAFNLIDGLGLMGIYIFNKSTPFDNKEVQKDWIVLVDQEQKIIDRIIDNVSKTSYLKNIMFSENKTFVSCSTIHDLMNSVMTTYRTSIDIQFQDSVQSRLMSDAFQFNLCQRLKEVSWSKGAAFIEWIDSTLWQYYNNFQVLDIKIFKTCVVIVKNFINQMKLRDLYIYANHRDFKALQAELRNTQPGDYSQDDEIMKEDFMDDQNDEAQKTEAEIQIEQQTSLKTSIILKKQKVLRFRRIIKIFQSASKNLIDYYRDHNIAYPQSLRSEYRNHTSDDHNYNELQGQPKATFREQPANIYRKIRVEPNPDTQDTASADEEEKIEKKQKVKKSTKVKLSSSNDDFGSNSSNKKVQKPKQNRQSSNQEADKIEPHIQKSTGQKQSQDERQIQEQNPILQYFDDSANQVQFNSAFSQNQPQAQASYEYTQFPTQSNSTGYIAYQDVQPQNMFGSYNPGGPQYQPYFVQSAPQQIVQRSYYEQPVPAYQNPVIVYEPQIQQLNYQRQPQYVSQRPVFQQHIQQAHQLPVSGAQLFQQSHQPNIQVPQQFQQAHQPNVYGAQLFQQSQQPNVQGVQQFQQSHQPNVYGAQQYQQSQQQLPVQGNQQVRQNPPNFAQGNQQRPPLLQPQHQNAGFQHLNAPNDKKSGDGFNR